MNLKKALRTAIIVEWMAIILNLITSDILLSYLPIELQNISSIDYLTISASILLPIGILLLSVYLISSIGLFLYKPWAKFSYLISGVLAFSLLLLTGPVIDHAVTYFIGEIETLAFGFILALVFFTNVLAPNKK